MNKIRSFKIKATRTLAAKLGYENIEFPGHHDLSFWMPKDFANAIQKNLNRYGIRSRTIPELNEYLKN